MIKKRIVIIGAGVAGLALSALLSKRGYQVTVIEKNQTAGGRARFFKSKGFLFDYGPSWYLMPKIFEDFFKLFGKTTNDFYHLKKLNPSYQVFIDSQRYIIYSKLSKNFKLFNKLETDGDKKLIKYLLNSQSKYNIALKYLYTNFNSYLSYLKFDLLLNALRFDLFKNMHSFVKTYFKSETIHKLILFNLLFLGSTPKNTPALYSILTHIDLNLGIWYPIGGMNKLVTALLKLSTDYQTKFLFNKEVKKIIIQNNKVTHLQLNKQTINTDLVISNADYQHTEIKLLDKPYQSYSEKYWNSKKVAPSAFIIFIGLNKKVKTLLHHNIYIDNNWQLHFNQIDKTPIWPTNPSYYICSTSKTDPTTAPSGCENLVILVPVAPNLKDTSKIRSLYTKKIISHLESLMKQDLKGNIIFKKIYSLRDFQLDYHAYQGTGFGLAHTLFQTASQRPQIQSKKVKNLFYVGQYTQPGIGLPMCIISAQLVAKEIDKYFKDHV